MKILHLDLKPVGNDYAEFRYFWDNPNDYQFYQLPLAKIKALIKQAESDYYTRLPQDYAKTGKVLYDWLDGSKRLFQQAINEHRRNFVLAIAATEGLAHLPWEVLHDGQRFLVERAIVPVRWKADGISITWDEKKWEEEQIKNRALNVLFMATSPLGIEPVLDFEAEEGRILEATKRKPLSLIVEESGCLKEIRHLVEDYEKQYFDVFHLTGHATKKDEQPCFITETELGEPEYSSAEDIACELQFELPKLIFLSGCQTGYSWDKGTVPSMAEALLMEGATAVLSWGKKVSDTDAIAAAATLYENLSAGNTVTEAVAKTYQTLIKNQAQDWHLLRLYIAETLPGALVTRGQKPVPRPSVATEFLDSENQVRVATRENFIGRRRQLQNCLRELKTPNEKIGVLIHGMGGLGKSTIASRLCDRLSGAKKIVWWRQFDESSLVSKLADELSNQEQRRQLRESHEELKYRLRDALSTLNQLVFVFDDFEWNLEPRDGGYILKPEVSKVLNALVWAIKNQKNISDHRIIITCRYDFESDLLHDFYKQPLEGLRKADLQKKLKQLDNFNSDNIDKTLIERALKLADGNPRLLEWLNSDVLSKEDVDSELSKFEASSDDWKSKIIWITDDAPKLKIDDSIEKIVNRCLVFEIPVPMLALEAVCESISNYKDKLKRAIELGLIEVSPEPVESNRVYRVSRILPHIIPGIQLPPAPQVYSLYQKAHEKLHQLWGKKENKSEEKWLEIFRLKFANKENSERFREGFSQMLAVQYNPEADSAFESELRGVACDLVESDLFTALNNYLRQRKWQEADEETAWIFYQVMVKRGYKDWEDLLQNFPRQLLEEIDRLWLQKSNNKFGISLQKEIYQRLGQPKADEREKWFEFCDRVGWWEENDYLTYNEICKRTINSEAELPVNTKPALPVIFYTYSSVKGWCFMEIVFV
jgi:CHAT domain-containing protein